MDVGRECRIVLGGASAPLPAREVRQRLHERGHTIRLQTVVLALEALTKMDNGAPVVVDRTGRKAVYSLREAAGE